MTGYSLFRYADGRGFAEDFAGTRRAAVALECGAAEVCDAVRREQAAVREAFLQRMLIVLCLAMLACAGAFAAYKGDAHARRMHALAATQPMFAVDRVYAHQDGDAAQYEQAVIKAQQAVSSFHNAAHSDSELSLAQTLALHLDYAKYCRWRVQNDSRSAVQETWQWCTDAHHTFESTAEERVREIAAGR